MEGPPPPRPPLNTKGGLLSPGVGGAPGPVGKGRKAALGGITG